MSIQSVGLASLNTARSHSELNCELYFPAQFCFSSSYSFTHAHNKGPPNAHIITNSNFHLNSLKNNK